MIKAGVINKYSQVCKKKEKNNRKMDDFVVISLVNNWFPSLCVRAKTVGNRRVGTKRCLWTYSGLIKEACATGAFAVFSVPRSDQTAYILSTDQSLSSASGALLIFIVKSTLNYTRMLRPSKKKKKKQTIRPDKMPLYAEIWKTTGLSEVRTHAGYDSST